MSEADGVMGDDAVDHAWLEVFSAIAAGETTVRWYVEYCTADSRSTVADRRTEDEAILAAKEWDLPITPCSRPSHPSREISAQMHSRHSAIVFGRIWNVSRSKF